MLSKEEFYGDVLVSIQKRIGMCVAEAATHFVKSVVPNFVQTKLLRQSLHHIWRLDSLQRSRNTPTWCPLFLNSTGKDGQYTQECREGQLHTTISKQCALFTDHLVCF
jgi:hypothetical protein